VNAAELGPSGHGATASGSCSGEEAGLPCPKSSFGRCIANQRLRNKDTPSMYILLKSPCAYLLFNPQSNTSSSFTLSDIESVFHVGLFQKYVFKIYMFATETVLLIKYSF
jgi:hypothetical protein